jgi:hypothetical protein
MSTTSDPNYMAIPELRSHRDQLMKRARELASSGELAGDDLKAFESLEAEISAVQDRTEKLERLTRAAQNPGAVTPGDGTMVFDEATGQWAYRQSRPPETRTTPQDQGGLGARGHSPLLVSDEHLRGHVQAIRDGSTFGAVEERTLVTVATDTGSPGAWGSGQIKEPVTLRRFADIPVGPLTGATAQMPSLTLPAGSAGVAESTAHGEFNATDVVNLSTLRYGRWSEVTSFVASFTDLQALNGAQAVGIARDLNLVDLTAIQTAAGTVVAFDSPNLDRNIRQAILKVAAAVVGDPEEVVLFGTSAALGVITGYAPASGGDRGSVSTRVYGARVYVTEAALAGNIYMFHPRGFKVFAGGLGSASVLDATNGSYKFGTWLHSTAPGLFIVGSAAGVDVVTP